MLAAPGPLAGHERRDGGERAERAGGVVVVGDHVQHGRVVAALGRREARARLEDRVEAGERGERSGGAVARDRGVHQPRIQAREPIPADVEPLHDAGAEVVDHDVGRADEVEEGFATRGTLQVEHEGALAAVPPDEAEELEAEGISAGRLDLHDVGAELGEQQRTEGAGDEAREIEHPDALEAGARSVAGAGAEATPPAGRLGQDRGGVAARQRRRTRRRRGRVGEHDGRRRLPRRPEHRILDGHGQAEDARLGVAEEVGAAADRAAGHVGRAQRLDPGDGRACGEHRLELGPHQRPHVGVEERHRLALQVRMGEEVQAIERREQLGPEHLGERADEEPAVGRRVEPVGGIDAARVAAQRERAPVARARHEGPAVERECPAHAAHVDRLPGGATVAREERRAHAERGEDSRHVADHRRDQPHRTPRPRPLERLDAGGGRQERFLGRQAGVRTAPGGHAAADEIGIRVRWRDGVVGQHRIDMPEQRPPAGRVERDRTLAAGEDVLARCLARDARRTPDTARATPPLSSRMRPPARRTDGQ